MTSITPFLWFDNNVPEAVAFYKSVFPNAKVETVNDFMATLELEGQRFNALNGGPVAARAMLGQDVTYDRVPYFFSDQYDLGMEYSGWAPPGSYDQVVIRGDGRGSAILDEQIPGRAARIHEVSGKTVGILYDCTDGFDRGFRATAGRRGANYKEKGWTQIRPRRRGGQAR